MGVKQNNFNIISTINNMDMQIITTKFGIDLHNHKKCKGFSIYKEILTWFNLTKFHLVLYVSGIGS